MARKKTLSKSKTKPKAKVKAKANPRRTPRRESRRAPQPKTILLEVEQELIVGCVSESKPSVTGDPIVFPLPAGTSLLVIGQEDGGTGTGSSVSPAGGQGGG